MVDGVMDRFFSRVEIGDCWEWTGAKAGGYGRFRLDNRKVLAHRAVYVMLVGDIPDGLEIDHLCFNKPCVNPDHLELVTRAENMRRARHKLGKNNYWWGRDVCKRGHPLDGVNKRPGWTGRVCRTCNNASAARYRARKAAARKAVS